MRSDSLAGICKQLVRLADILLHYRGAVKFILHLGIFLCAYLFAYLIRFEFSIPAEYTGVIRDTIVLLLVAKALAFLAFGLFRGWWRHFHRYLNQLRRLLL